MGGDYKNEIMLSSFKKENNIVFRKYNDNVKILNLSKNSQLILNSVGSDIWLYIAQSVDGVSFKEIAKYIMNMYDITDPSILDGDIYHYLIQLYSEGCIITDCENISTIRLNDISNSSEIDILDDNNHTNGILGIEDELNSMTLEVTYHCNEKCVHCYICDDDIKELSLEKYKEIIDELFLLNVLYLSFTGGEPFLRNDFIEIYEYAHKKGFAINIYTNANLIRDQHVKIFKEKLPRTFFISVYSMNPLKHDEITQINGSFNKTINSINSLVSINCRIVLNIPVMNINVDDIIEIIEWAKSRGISYKVSFNMTPKNNGNNSPLSFQNHDEKKILKILKAIDFESSPIAGLYDFVCGAGLNSLTITPYGSVQACVGLPISIGSVMTKTVTDNWKNNSLLNNIRNIRWQDCDDCVSCIFKTNCNHCLGLSYFETNNLKSRNKGDCFIAEIKHRYLAQKN